MGLGVGGDHDAIQQNIGGQFAHLVIGLANGGQADFRKIGEANIIEAHHGDIFRNLELRMYS